jgi:endonuclease-3
MFMFCSNLPAAMQLSLALDETSLIQRVRARLFATFGPQRDAQRLDPVSQLVNGILSARTRDAVSIPAFVRLRRRYASWDLLCKAQSREIEGLIRPVTYADRKAEYLPRALRMVVARCGSLNLDFLAAWPEESGMQWLDGLPGVGPKIAAAVLNFSSLRKRVLPVDTHLLRIGARLGLLPPEASYGTGHDVFTRLIPDTWDADDLYEFHWQMKYHGQRTCSYAAPTCSRCPLLDLCPRRLSGSRRHANITEGR